MNNRGFGITEVLLFIGISMFTLIIITIYINNNLTSNDNILKEETSSTIETLKPTEMKIPEEYLKLENKLKNSAKKYKINKNQNIIISLYQLKKDGLISKLIDPNDNKISCNGYVIYNSKSKEYTPYVNCNGMYSTNNYNSEFE